MFNSILKYITKKEWGLIGVIGVLNVIQVYLTLKIPEYMASITSYITTPSYLAVLGKAGLMDHIYTNGINMILCAVGSLATVIVICFLASRIAARVAQELRSKMYSSVESFSMGDINKFSLPSLITRSTNDVTQVQMILTFGLQLIMFSPMLAVGAMLKISAGSLEWTLATAVAMILLVIMFGIVLWAVFPKFKAMQKH